MEPEMEKAVDRTTQMVQNANGRTLCFAEWGDLSGRPVFSLHGTPGCRLLSRRKAVGGFEDLMRLLGVRLISFDRPGYGGSERQRARSVADTAADVETIANRLGIDRFAVEGSSSGSAHALATAALLEERVLRLACVAPMAPYYELGQDEWSRGQDPEVIDYVGWCLQGEDRMASEFAREDALVREAADGGDPTQRADLEQTRQGIWGWVDDELAAFAPWGFDPSAIEIPTAIWYDPGEAVLPRQHAEWLAGQIGRSVLETTTALGHRAEGDPKPDWGRLYSWLNGS
jgi:pimeloyl-ACP methyl ester carboxylesterase